MASNLIRVLRHMYTEKYIKRNRNNDIFLFELCSWLKKKYYLGLSTYESWQKVKNLRNNHNKHTLVDASKFLSFVGGNAQHLNTFNNESFNIYTIVFELWNVTNVNEAPRAAYRVLKQYIRYLCLEFSKV